MLRMCFMVSRQRGIAGRAILLGTLLVTSLVTAGA